VKGIYEWAKNYCIEHGPLVIELETFRYFGHSMSDPGIIYRAREEINDYKKNKDCITKIENIILENSIKTQKQLEDIAEEIFSEVEQAAEQAAKDPLPDRDELT